MANAESSYVWVDHCELKSINWPNTGKDDYDGLLDITHGSDWITVSYTTFHDHWKTMLIGHADDNEAEDYGRLHVTIHHCHFYRVGTRCPMMRFAVGHVYNNYYNNVDSGVDSRMKSNVWVENNHFENTDGTINAGSSQNSGACNTGNIFTNSKAPTIAKTCSGRPPYSYSLDSASSVKDNVVAQAGSMEWERSHYKRASTAQYVNKLLRYGVVNEVNVKYCIKTKA